MASPLLGINVLGPIWLKALTPEQGGTREAIPPMRGCPRRPGRTLQGFQGFGEVLGES